MKRKTLSYDNWKNVISKTFFGRHVDTDFLKGYVGILQIHEAAEEQFWTFNGKDIPICANGMKWFYILPQDDFYCITATMNEKDEILLWYIDMIADQGTEKNGNPYFDDLYLDLVVSPNGDICEYDMDELEEALRTDGITQSQYDLAVSTSRKLQEGLLLDIQSFTEYTKKCFRLLGSQKTHGDGASN